MPPVRVEHDGARTTLWLARPAKKNALTVDMYEQLATALGEAAADGDVRVAVIRAEGDAFCAGNDLVDFLQRPPTGTDSPVFAFLLALVDFPKPLIAAVQGPAVGIGTTLLLHCDLAVATTGARFQLPFVNLALVPEAGSSWLMPRLLGQRHAAELLLLGEAFGPADALRHGLVNAVVSPDELDPWLDARVATLASRPPAAMRLAKQLMKTPDRDALLAAMQAEGTRFIERLGSAETAEAIEAFLEKRAPDFSKFS